MSDTHLRRHGGRLAGIGIADSVLGALARSSCDPPFLHDGVTPLPQTGNAPTPPPSASLRLTPPPSQSTVKQLLLPLLRALTSGSLASSVFQTRVNALFSSLQHSLDLGRLAVLLKQLLASMPKVIFVRGGKEERCRRFCSNKGPDALYAAPLVSAPPHHHHCSWVLSPPQCLQVPPAGSPGSDTASWLDIIEPISLLLLQLFSRLQGGISQAMEQHWQGARALWREVQEAAREWAAVNSGGNFEGRWRRLQGTLAAVEG